MFSEVLRKAPLLRVVVPFIAGIALGNIIHLPGQPGIVLVWVLASAILLFLGYWLSHTYHRRWVFGFILFICLFGTGSWYYTLYNNQVFSNIPVSGGRAYVAEVLMHEKVTPSFEVYTVRVKEQSLDSRMNPVRAKIRLYLPLQEKFSGLLPGDLLIVRGSLARPNEPTNPGEFNYRRSLEHKGIWGVGYVRDPDAVLIKPGAGRCWLRRAAAILQNKFTGLFRKHSIQGDELALLSALTIGVRDEIDNDLNQAFSASGAMHVLSVSGLHVGIVYLVIARLLTIGARNRFLRIPFLLLQIGFLWFYAFLTGLSPAVNRAAAMFSFLAIGKSLKRQAGTANVLSGSALILLLVNPFMIFDIGFQLSYCAVFFISVLQPLIYNLLDVKNRWVNQVWKLIALSLAAQAGTFPLSVMYFNQFPNYFLITNLVVVPLAAVILYLSIAMLILSWIPLLGTLLALILHYALKGMIWSVEAIENLPYSVMHNLHLSLVQTVWLYLLILLFLAFLSFRRRWFLFAGLTGFAVFLLFSAVEKLQSSTRETFTVFNRSSSTIMMFSSGNRGYVFSTGNALQEASRVSKSYAAQLGLRNITYINLDTLNTGHSYYCPGLCFSSADTNIVLFQSARQSAMFLGSRNKKRENIKLRSQVDYVVIGEGFIRNGNSLQFAVLPSRVIIDSSVPPWELHPGTGDAPMWFNNAYIVASRGAFSVKNGSFSGP